MFVKIGHRELINLDHTPSIRLSHETNFGDKKLYHYDVRNAQGDVRVQSTLDMDKLCDDLNAQIKNFGKESSGEFEVKGGEELGRFI